MSSQWFVQKDDLVEGPLTTEAVQARATSGQLLSTHLIWGRGLDQWYTLNAWSKDLTGLTAKVKQEPVQEVWHFASGGQSSGPVPREALANELKDLDSLGTVMLWTKGMKEWAPLFEFHDILSEIGVNKRQFPRADLTGKAVMKGDGNTLVAPLVSVSEGGFGIQLDGGLVPGQILTIELHSPAFREVLHAKAEMRYGSKGIIGMKFTQINQETKGAIIQFVRQTQMRFTLKHAA